METLTVYVAEFDIVDDKLRVYELHVKPWGEHEYTAERPIPALGHKTRVPKYYVHPTPEAATAAWVSAQREIIASLERRTAAARAALATGEKTFVLHQKKRTG